MACCSVKLYIISRFFFFVFLVAQPALLSKFVVDHENEDGFFGLAALVVIPLFCWIGTLYRGELKYRLSLVWFLYSCVLVIMMGVIFGRAVIEDNKLREQEIATCLCTPNANNTTTGHSFFDSKFLKITLSFTPGLMLLLLTSVTDESGILKQLYLTTVMDLFDGIEMIEVLHEDVCDKIPMGWEIAVLVAALLFFLFSFLEVHQVKFEKPNDAGKFRKKTAILNTCIQIILNLAFLVIRSVLWLHYDFDSGIFLAKSVISLAITLVDVLETLGYIITKSQSDVGNPPRQARPLQMYPLGISNLSQQT